MRFKYLSPLTRIFRGSSPRAPATRDPLAALGSGSPEFILATALDSGDEPLRAAAIAKLPDGDALRRLTGVSGDVSPSSIPSSLERIAQQRMAQLIDAGTVDFAGLCDQRVNTAVLLAVAGFSNDAALLPRALAAIDDPHQVAMLVTQGASSRLRQLAAHSIQDPAELQQLLKQLRGKDKGVYKIIKQKCDALRAEERRVAQLDDDMQALCVALERHGQRLPDEHYLPSLTQLEIRWATLEPVVPARVQAAAALRARASAAVDRCREVVAEHARRLAQQAIDESQRSALRTAEEQSLAAADREARQHAEIAALAAAQTAAAAAALREADENARAARLAAEALLVRQISGLIGKANGALRDGNTSRAAGLRRALEEKLPAIPVPPPHIAREILKLDAKLSDYKEWKEHAVAPKRAELIEEMEALIGSPDEPQALADRIKQLQEDWTTISKGIVSDTEADWERFRQASVTAYRPCRDYFEAQAARRQANLEKRSAILERLRAFEATQSAEFPDWRAIATVLREAPREWREYFPIDRAAARAMQREFDAAVGRLQARLDTWHADNAAAKKALIQRAQQLRANDDSREAVDAVKRLQLQWKDVGTVPRDLEQTLWQEFREQCDAVYQKRQHAYEEYAAGLEANKARAVRLCEEVEEVTAQPGTTLRAGAEKIPQWRAAFDALGEMPMADQRPLRNRFERAVDLCQTQRLHQQTLEKEQSFTNLLEAATHIQLYAWAGAQKAPDAERAALKTAAEAFIAAVPLWPKGGAHALKDAWTHAATGEPDIEAQATALRMLCIRGEILVDKPTPAEDQPLRREYQVQRLVQRMGQRGEANADELDALALEWVRAGTAPPALYESLLARFMRCRR